MKPALPGPDQIREAHALYCQLTGQTLRMAYDRERAWFELLRAGYTLADLTRVIRYLQREIRHERRNVGALKLRNLLQPDQFEEDLNISRVRLHALPQRVPVQTLKLPTIDPSVAQQRRADVVESLARLKANL